MKPGFTVSSRQQVVLSPQPHEYVGYRQTLPHLAFYVIFFNYNNFPDVSVFNFRKKFTEI